MQNIKMSIQAVILAAGEGTRMRPITETIPKPLVKVAGKPLIEHIAGALPEEVTELIIVIGYLREQIKQYCGDNFLGRKVTYVVQEKMTGTAGALALVKPYLNTDPGSRFFVLMGDDILDAQCLKDCLKHDRAIVVSQSSTPEKFGVVETDNKGFVTQFLEKPENPTSNLVSTGTMILDNKVFNYTPTKPGKKGEFYITDLVNQMISSFPVAVVEAGLWIPIATPEDIKKAEEILANRNR